MLMPVEEDHKTKGKQWIETEKKQGKANFFEKECLHGRKWEEDVKVIHEKKLWKTKARKGKI